jgi:superfamily I DNA and/or RNA helicase
LTCVRSSDDKYQGIGFLRNKKRINVALTRAQHGLIIAANLEFLSKDKNWEALLEKQEIM